MYLRHEVFAGTFWLGLLNGLIGRTVVASVISTVWQFSCLMHRSLLLAWAQIENVGSPLEQF